MHADQFYVGGANSVRGFTVRTIGPGRYKSPDSKYAYIDQTGDVKLEANLELRAPIFGDLGAAVFLDAGNVWLLRSDPARPGSKFTLNNLREFAVGTGLGLNIARSILDGYGMDYGAESTVGKGSNFWFEMETAEEE